MKTIIEPTTGTAVAEIDLSKFPGACTISAYGVLQGAESIAIEIATPLGWTQVIEGSEPRSLTPSNNAVHTESKATFRLNKSVTVNQVGVRISGFQL